MDNSNVLRLKPKQRKITLNLLRFKPETKKDNSNFAKT